MFRSPSFKSTISVYLASSAFSYANAFKTRISFEKHMKRGAHLLAPGPKDAKGGFVREFILLLDGISVEGQSTEDRKRSPL